MNEQQYHCEVMAELQMMEEHLDEYNRLFLMDRDIKEFAASHEKEIEQ